MKISSSKICQDLQRTVNGCVIVSPFSAVHGAKQDSMETTDHLVNVRSMFPGSYRSRLASTNALTTTRRAYIAANGPRQLLSSSSLAVAERQCPPVANKKLKLKSENENENNNTTSNERLDISGLAHSMREEVRSFTTKLYEESGRRIRLAGVLATNRADEGAWAYSRKIHETFLEDGLDYELQECVGDRPQDIEATIRQLNHRSDIDGIMVFYPIFPQRTADFADTTTASSGAVRATYLNPSNGVHYTKSALPYYLNAQTGVYYKTVDDYLRDCVIPSKDVEGLCHKQHHRDKWQRQLFRTRATPNNVYIPCTAMAVWKILDHYYLQQVEESHNNYCRNNNNAALCWPKDYNATIINRSTILGRPLAALMASEGFANIFSMDDRIILHYSGDDNNNNNYRMRRCCSENDTGTTRLEDCMAMSHIVVTAVPDPNFQIPTDALQHNTLVVDVTGTNINTAALTRESGRGIRFVNSVGKITIASLQHSLIRLFEQNESTRHSYRQE